MQHQRNHMYYKCIGFSDISKEKKCLDYGIQKERIYHLLPT
jgi:hypothetical protein